MATGTLGFHSSDAGANARYVIEDFIEDVEPLVAFQDNCCGPVAPQSMIEQIKRRLGDWVGMSVGQERPFEPVWRFEIILAQGYAARYVQLLHRTPSAVEVGPWVGLLKGGFGDQQLLASFASSAEYFALAGGTDQAWVGALYRDLLGRSPSTGEVAGWLGVLAAGASRFSVAFGFANSVEHLAGVVAGYYQRYLGRTADVSELAGWVHNIQLGMSNEQVIAAFLASNEFFVGHGSSISGWLTGVYQVVLGRAPDPIGFNDWAGYLMSQLPGVP